MIIKENKYLPSGDGSLQYSMISDIGRVDFAILNGEMCAHIWKCPKQGKWFLKQLEEHANKLGLKLTIPTVLNPALEHICELWSKE